MPQFNAPTLRPHFIARRLWPIAALCSQTLLPGILSAGIGAETSVAIRSVELDPHECFRVRELQFTRGEVQYFLTDGYLIFSKPVLGSPIAMVFSSAVEGGDGEVLLLPPDREERRMLSTHAGGPNLEEHLRDALFYFADNTGAEIDNQMRGSEWIHRDEKRGAEMAEKYTRVLRNIVKEFETRLLLDLLTGPHQANGFFASLLGGKTLGNFDVVFDPRAFEQVFAGREASDSSPEFTVWTSYTPKLLKNSPRTVDFHADQYHIDARLDAKLHMRVESSYTVSEITRDLNALSFELSRQMQVVSAEVDGRPAEIAESANFTAPGSDPGDRLFLIVPSEPLPAGTQHLVKVVHEGDVITAGPNHVYFVGSRGRWYPHRALEFALFDLKFRFPKNLDLVAPGESIMDMVDGDERVIERRVDTPLPMAGFNLGSYHRTVVKRGEFTIEMCSNRGEGDDGLQTEWSFSASEAGHPSGLHPNRAEAKPIPADPNARINALAGDIADVMGFFAHHFGPPPLRKLIVSPIPGRFGQGFGGLIYLSTMAYMSPTGKAFADLDPQYKIFFTELMHAHEVAHQWWGNLVLTAGYHDEWITEALANYSAMLYLEKRAGSKAVNTLLEAYRAGLIEKNAAGVSVEQAGPVTEGRRIELEGKPGAWVAVMYGKGTWIMQMLHARMGDAGFWKMLAELRRRYERKSLTTEQFRELCAEFMPEDIPDRKLQAFFDQWVYGMGIPTLRLNSAVKGSGAALHVTGTLSQSDAPDDFSADFPIEIDLRGKRLIKWVRSSSDPVGFSVAVPAHPNRVELDPGDQFLKR